LSNSYTNFDILIFYFNIKPDHSN